MKGLTSKTEYCACPCQTETAGTVLKILPLNRIQAKVRVSGLRNFAERPLMAENSLTTLQ